MKTAEIWHRICTESMKFLSHFDQISNPNRTDFCSKYVQNLIQTFGRGEQNLKDFAHSSFRFLFEITETLIAARGRGGNTSQKRVRDCKIRNFEKSKYACSDFCFKSVLHFSDHQLNKKNKNFLRTQPKMHVVFELKNLKFLSDLDHISIPNLTDFCSKSEPNMNFCQKSSGD